MLCHFWCNLKCSRRLLKVVCHCKDKFTHLVHRLFILNNVFYFLLYIHSFEILGLARHHQCVFEHRASIADNQHRHVHWQILLIELKVVAHMLLFNQGRNGLDIVNTVLLYFSFIHRRFVY